MMKINRLILLIFILLIVSCKNSKNSNEIDDLNKKEIKSIEKKDTENDISILNKALKEAEMVAKNNVKSENFKKTIKSAYQNFPELTTEILIGHLFTDDKRHVVIKRELNYSAKINIYSINENDKIKQLKYLECGVLSYVGDSIYDINGDGFNDLSLQWNPTSGCCLANNYIISLYDTKKNDFSDNFDFLNPTFSPKEKIIRGFDYGQPNDVSLYKYKWNGFSVDTIEYINHNSNNKREFIKSKRKIYHATEKDGKVLKKIPSEYHKINDYDWFTGDIMNKFKAKKE